MRSDETALPVNKRHQPVGWLVLHVAGHQFSRLLSKELMKCFVMLRGLDKRSHMSPRFG